MGGKFDTIGTCFMDQSQCCIQTAGADPGESFWGGHVWTEGMWEGGGKFLVQFSISPPFFWSFGKGLYLSLPPPVDPPLDGRIPLTVKHGYSFIRQSTAWFFIFARVCRGEGGCGFSPPLSHEKRVVKYNDFIILEKVNTLSEHQHQCLQAMEL